MQFLKAYLKKIKHICEYIGFLALIWLFKLIGFEQAKSLFTKLIKLISKCSPYSKIIQTNLNIAFPRKTASQKQEIEAKVWDNFARFLVEFIFMNELASKDDLFEIKGLENIEKLKANNHPYLVATAHLANWDLIPSISKIFGDKVAIIYRKMNNPYMDEYVKNSRRKNELLFIEKGHSGVRSLVKAIKEHYTIAMLIDQKMDEGLNVPFFTKNAKTSVALAQFAIKYSLPIIPLRMERIGNSTKFKLTIEPPLNIDNSMDEIAIMTIVNQKIESWVADKPEDWFWMHKRWNKEEY